MKIFYFTGTGNSLYVAKHFKGDLYSIPKVLKSGEKEFEDDVIGLVFPCYFFGTPPLVKEFIKNVKLRGKYIFTLITYGNFSGDCVNQFVNEARQQRLKINYANELYMVDNYLLMFDMNEEKYREKEVENNLGKMIEDIGKKKNYIKRSNLKAKLSTRLKKYSLRDLRQYAKRKYTVESHCNGCGICMKVCPRDNIEIEGKPIFDERCEFCMACVHVCPSKEIKVKEELNGEARYKHPEVSIMELMQANW